MWVCLCTGVTDRQIRAAVDRGARTPSEIGRQCRAGTRCGGCLPEVRRLMKEQLSEQLSAAACFDCPAAGTGRQPFIAPRPWEEALSA